MQTKTKRIVMIIILTLILAAMIGFLLQTSKDVRWGGGFWDSWLQTHCHLTSAVAHQIVFWIRKTIHFVSYGGLTLLLWWYFILWGVRRAAAAWGLTGTALVASFDEYNQALSSFRSGQPADVLLDCCGGIVFITMVYTVKYFYRRNATSEKKGALK